MRVTIPVLFGRHYVSTDIVGFGATTSKLELQLGSRQSVDVLVEGFDLAIRMGVLGIESEDYVRINWPRCARSSAHRQPPFGAWQPQQR